MIYSFLDARLADGLLAVTVNRPDKRNALSQAVLAELRACFDAHRDNPGLVAATLTGAGARCFAAGGDLREFDSLRAREPTLAMGRHSLAALDAVRTFPVPVIALLNGDAIGGGAELAVACDLRIFAAHSRIAFVQSSLGITPAWGGGADLIRIVGAARALRLFMRAEFLTADEAYRLGLADAVANSDRPFADFAADFLAPVLQRPAHVMRAYKRLVLAARETPEAARLRDLESEVLVETWLDPAHWQAHDAVLTKISSRQS
jgi:enoyl-CoA hydratase/carnithine racemase